MESENAKALSASAKLAALQKHLASSEAKLHENRQKMLKNEIFESRRYENNFLNFDGRVLRVEPLANVSHLEKYIGKMVSKR